MWSLLGQAVLSIGIVGASVLFSSNGQQAPSQEPAETDPNSGLIKLSLVLGVIISGFTIYQFATARG